MAVNERPIIIKKVIKKGGHGHHGGAWKVAYADFVTAMMAFFLLLWLLNSTTEEQRQGISNYFSPSSVSDSTSGAGGILGGMALSKINAMQSNAAPLLAPTKTQEGVETKEAVEEAETRGSKHDGEGQDNQKLNDPMHDENEEALEEVRAQEKASFEKVEQKIKQMLRESPQMAMLAQNLMMEMTDEGLRIQIVDQDKKPMFASGQVEPLAHTRLLLEKVAGMIKTLPNDIAIAGHTDAKPYGSSGYSNWDLSADRANASRRVLSEVGVPESRIASVTGKASRDPLIKDDPLATSNRRVSITLLYTDLATLIKEREKPITPIRTGVFKD